MVRDYTYRLTIGNILVKPLLQLLFPYYCLCTVKHVEHIELNVIEAAIICSCTIGQVHLLVYYIKTKSRLSVCLSAIFSGRLYLRGLYPDRRHADMLDMKRPSLQITKNVFKTF